MIIFIFQPYYLQLLESTIIVVVLLRDIIPNSEFFVHSSTYVQQRLRELMEGERPDHVALRPSIT
jgi:hypothetical protein